jgi:hypothetical protein
MMRGSSLLLEGESHQLFCRVFLDETLSHFCWEDDDLRSTALPLEFVHDIIVIGGDENSDEDSENTPLPIFALVLSNEQVLKVTCPNASEFQLWFHGLQRLLALSHNVDEADVTHGQSPARNGSNGRSDSNRGGPDYDDEDAAALAPYDYAEDHEEYGDGHAVSNTFSPSASLRSNIAREDHEAEVRLRQQMFSVEQRLAEAEAALRVFDANGGSSKTSGQYGSYNDDTPPAPSQSPSYKKFQPQKLAVESHNADAGTGKFYDESESVDTDMYASSASKDDEYWRGQDDAESTSGYTSTSHDSVTQAESQLSAMQNSILLLCDQVQDLRGKLNSSRPSSSKKSKFDELARAKRELMRMREENEALAARCHELSLMQSPHRQSDKQQVRQLAAYLCIDVVEPAFLILVLSTF